MLEILELLPGTNEYEEHQQALKFECMNNEVHFLILENFKLASKNNLFIECCHENDIMKAKYLLNLKDGPVDVNSKSEDKNWSGKIFD